MTVHSLGLVPVDPTLCDKLVSDLRQISGFSRILWYPLFTNTTHRHDITEKLLKVALNTIPPNP